MSTTPETCLDPECERLAGTRGLCSYHYSYAAFLVRKGKTSWEELEAHGKALAAKPKGPGKSSWLTDFAK